MHMIVIGADPHKSQHTVAAVEAATGQLLGRADGLLQAKGRQAELLRWGSGARAPSACGRSRTAASSPATSSACWSPAASGWCGSLPSTWRAPAARCASAASPTRSTRSRSPGRRCEKGPTSCPPPSSIKRRCEIKLLLDHREDLEQESTRIVARLRWHLHDLWPELELPQGVRAHGVARADRPPPGRAEQSTRVRDLPGADPRAEGAAASLARARARDQRPGQGQEPALLELPGCGPSPPPS